MIIAIATLLVALLPADVKLQNAKLERTHTSDDSTSRWFVRPYVPVYRDGKLMQVKQRIYLGQVSLVPEREAQRARRVVLDKINRRQIEPQARQLFGDFLDSYIEGHVSKLAVSTQRKYACHINKHIRPAFGAMRMCDAPVADASLVSGVARFGPIVPKHSGVPVVSASPSAAARGFFLCIVRPVPGVRCLPVVYFGNVSAARERAAVQSSKSEGFSKLCPSCAGPILAQCETLTCGWGSVNFFSCDDQL